MTTGDEPRVCVVLPTYNNRRTIRAVVEGALARSPNVLVVNDGCTDGTDEILRSIPGIEVIQFASNRGKGAALAAGLDRAHALGYTHAISMDTDGQHDAADIPKFIDAVGRNPAALVIGVRELPKVGFRPRKTAFDRAHSNFWVWVLTGQWVPDTQTGFRAYPLQSVASLRLKTIKYDFETEIIVKALWLGVPLEAVPVRAEYGAGSESHFRIIRDSFWWTHLTAMLIWQRMLLPASMRRTMHLREFQDRPFLEKARICLRATFLQDESSPLTFALAIAVGVFFGIAPIWGFQMASAAAAAHKLKLSKPLAIAASNVSFGGAMPVIIYLSLVMGHLVMRGELDFSLSMNSLGSSAAMRYTTEYLLGAVLLAFCAAVVAGLASFALARSWSTHRAGPTGSRQA